MRDNNPHVVGVQEAASLGEEYPEGKVWTVEEVSKMRSRPFAASNGNGASAPHAAVTTQLLSRRYEGANGAGAAGVEFRLELRVDVDGKGALDMLSGDLFKVSGGILKHWGSFIVPTLDPMPAADGITLTGGVGYATNEQARVVRVGGR